MTDSIVEQVRTGVEHFNRGEIDQALTNMHEDFVMDWSNSIGPLKGVYEGREKAAELWRSFLDAWESVHWDPEEIAELDEEHVLLVNHVTMRGRGSGVDVDARGVQVWTFRDGRPSRVKLYQSREDALEAAGATRRGGPR